MIKITNLNSETDENIRAKSAVHFQEERNKISYKNSTICLNHDGLIKHIICNLFIVYYYYIMRSF
jgi:hypothetical protein